MTGLVIGGVLLIVVCFALLAAENARLREDLKVIRAQFRAQYPPGKLRPAVNIGSQKAARAMARRIAPPGNRLIPRCPSCGAAREFPHAPNCKGGTAHENAHGDS